jgi:hypothetical protein
MRRPLVFFRRTYGAGPLNLLASVAAFALAGYAFTKLFAGPTALNVALWFAGAIVLHDFVFFPLYTALDRLAGRALPAQAGPGAINYVRVPVALSAIAFLVFFPLILRVNEPLYSSVSTLSPDVYLGRWLLLVAALFAGSGVLLAVRWRRGARPATETETESESEVPA